MEKWDGEYKVIFENEYIYIFLHSFHIFDNRIAIFFMKIMNKCDYDLRKKTTGIINNGIEVTVKPRERSNNHKLAPGKLDGLSVMIDYDNNNGNIIEYEQEFEIYVEGLSRKVCK